MLCFKYLDTVLSATQQDLIVNPFQEQEFASVDPKLPVNPIPHSMVAAAWHCAAPPCG